MFEDIIGQDYKRLTPDDKTWDKVCENCDWASHILSNYPGKILCERDHLHKPKKFFCYDWKERKKVLDTNVK